MEILNNESGFEILLPKGTSSIIKVIGVGGGGNNALKHMYEKGIKGVDFVVCNTDAQALAENPVTNKIQLGVRETEGLGAGADPEVGRKAAEESIDEIKTMLGNNTKMVFITAGMGGGTGTGAAPVIAKIAREMGILTVGIVTVPFSFEGPRRLRQAEQGVEELRANVDSLIVINNDKLRQQFGDLGFKSGFAKADEVLSNAAKGMAEVITGYFIVNIDFRDAKSVLQNSGTALMSEGIASGENKAQEAVKKALDSPLLNDNKITGAKNVLLLIRSGDQEVTMDEIGIINDHIQKEAGNMADIIFGIGVDDSLGEDISVLVIATGFAPEDQKYSGTPEIIRVPLDEKPNVPAVEISAQTIQTTQPESPAEPQKSSRQVFTLDDTDDATSMDNVPSNAAFEQQPSFAETEVLEEEPADEIMFVGDAEPKSSISFYEEEPEEQKEEEPAKEMDLFSYNDLEAVSFTFDLEVPQSERAIEPQSEEKGIDFQLKEKLEIETEITQETSVQPVAIVEEQPQIEETKDTTKSVLFEIEQKEEFTIVEKKREDSYRIQERRNKLKEFNSRYHTVDEENLFENIPAFKRRNIDIDIDSNASEERITTFVAQDKEGKVELKENKFLNKDVD